MTTTTTTTMMMSTKKDTNDTPVVVVEDDVVIDGDSTNMTCGSIYFSLPVLTKSQWIQLLLLSLCFTLAFSSVTLVMSEAPLIVVNTGGQSQIAPISIAMFEIGKSFVVLPMQKIISKFGRKVVFLVGTILGLISSLVGLLGVLYLQPSLIIVSTLTCGFATGIAYGYRYAAIDVAANEREFAVTLCLSGGIIAAVVGPIGAIKSIHWFDIPYLGSYVMNFAFNTALVILIYFLKLDTDENSSAITKVPSISRTSDGRTSRISIEKKKKITEVEDDMITSIKMVFYNRAFIYGTLMATSVWVCMSLPLSVVGLAMSQEGISDKYILVAFIMHFLGMFLPSFFTGKLILSLGYAAVGFISVGVYVVATICNIFASSTNPTLWIIGQFFVGFAWNLGFSTSSVMISTCTMPGKDQRKLAAKTQSYCDFISFLGGGLITISAGYIYGSNSNGIVGWRMLNYIEFLFIAIMLVCIIAMWYNGGGSSGNDGNDGGTNTLDNAQSTINEKPWRRGSSFVTRSINVDDTNNRISRQSVFLGSGTFYTTVMKEDEEQDA